MESYTSYTASIRDVPYNDINIYLMDNGIPFSNNKNEAYSLAKELIESGLTDDVPESLADWINARDLKNLYDFSSYKISDILTSDEEDLLDLAEMMRLKKYIKLELSEF